MRLRSYDTYWQQKNGVPQTFPRLTTHETTEVVIIGGGITGALCADAFVKAGISTIVIDKRQVAHGSTSASTALLQYEIDVSLHKLQKQISKKGAITAYKLCEQSIFTLEKRIKELGLDCGFLRRSSLYFADTKVNANDLHVEYKARKQAGFAVEWLSESAVKKEYGIPAFGAIRSESGAQVDPYALTYALLKHSKTQGAKVYEKSEITNITQTKTGVKVETAHGSITAKRCVFAVGFEATEYLKEKTADLLTTFACISKPIGKKAGWKERSLLWNTADPYFYARITEENRILIGGEDIAGQWSEKRQKTLTAKTKKLINTFQKLFPDLPFELEAKWAGTFGETKDGLPYIGLSPEWKHCYFALGYGGNGITFSVIAAEALVQLYTGKKPSYLKLFAFGR